jgi:hypothetical protein
MANEEELSALHQTLVRFDCLIADMYEQEYFVSVLRAAADKEAAPLVYKYFSQLSDSQSETYDQMPELDATNTLERGNMLGLSVSQQAAWTVGESMSADKFMQSHPQQRVLLKLYDEDIHGFKMAEMVTVVGILEINKPDPQADSQMTDMAAGEELPRGVPNADCMPHIHVLASSPNHALTHLPQLPVSKASETYVKENSQRLGEAGQKLCAVLTLILNGDKVAAKYLMACLISRVYNRKGGILLGDLACNISGISKL